MVSCDIVRRYALLRPTHMENAIMKTHNIKHILVAIITSIVMMTPAFAFAQKQIELEPEIFESLKGSLNGLKDATGKKAKGKVVTQGNTHGVLVLNKEKWVKHGVFYTTKGKKVIKAENWKYGVKHGEQKEFYDTGELKTKSNYVNGKQKGVSVQYRKDGSKIEKSRIKQGMIRKSGGRN